MAGRALMGLVRQAHDGTKRGVRPRPQQRSSGSRYRSRASPSCPSRPAGSIVPSASARNRRSAAPRVGGVGWPRARASSPRTRRGARATWDRPPPRHQPGCLSFSRDVKQADRDAVESVRRSRGQHLAGRDRVSGQQHMPTVLLELEHMAHHRLGSPLTPRQRRSPRHRHHVVQLDALHRGLELARDKPPRGRLASTAGTADKQEHAGIVRTGYRNADRRGFPFAVARSAVGGPTGSRVSRRVGILRPGAIALEPQRGG